jgi:HEAT repeat protein
MPTISEALREALESDCAHSLEPVLKARRSEDYQALLEFLEQPPKPELRLTALHLLGRWGDRTVVSAIQRVLPDLDELGRCRAIDALGRLGGPEARAEMLKQTDDPSPQVRKFVVHALKRLGGPNAQDALQRIKQHDPAEFVRGAVR